MLGFLATTLIFVGWLLERRARKRAERARDDSEEAVRRCLDGWFEANQSIERLADQRGELQKQNLALAERVAAQSELLSKAAEREQEAARRLGYLFPRGLETPPSMEDALSPTWCKQEPAPNRIPAKTGLTNIWIDEKPTEEEIAAIANAPDGRILTADEVKAMEDALSPTWARRCEMRVRGVPCHRTATEMMPDGRHCCSECAKGWIAQEKPLKEIEEKGKRLYRMYEERFGKKASSDPSRAEQCPPAPFGSEIP